MKKSILLFFFLQVFLSVLSQGNLVPNGNFEGGNYQGGSAPINYYSDESQGFFNNTSTPLRFDNDMQDTWYCAKADKLFGGRRRDSPDWIDPNQWYNSENEGNCTQTKYVRCALANESIMVQLAGGHKLVKGQTYTFKVKARGGKGTAYPSHQFRLTFTADEEGLDCINKKKWYVTEFYVENSCDWHYFEHTFTVPDSDDKNYEDMGWLVLNVNYYRDGSNTPNDFGAVFNFDDVVLTIEPKCIDTRYIQDRVYANEGKIEQANVEIRAGAHVSPYSWQSQFPVVVKSSAMVIYRAPTVYLEPGFFIEEPGSYFETQVGTCVDNPCPGIPAFTPPPVAQCAQSFTLGNDFPLTPGIFYVWEPQNYFSAPWSRVTEVRRPDSDDGCVDAKLTIWTICGAQQVYNFKLQFIEAAPTIDIANVVTNPAGISGLINLQNATNYSIQGINTVTGEVVFEDAYTWNCQNGSQHIPFAVNHCTGNLCQNLEIKIRASNPCFGSVSESIQWQAPNVPDYDLQVSNLVSNNYDFQFDWAIPNTYDYVKIQVWNEAKTQKLCEWNYNRCSNPISTSSPFHFDIRNCLGSGCLAQCLNYKVVLETKQYCNTLVSHKEIAWNKSNTAFSMPVDYPNIITADDDGINDDLCFSPVGADWYEIVVRNRWGNVMHEEEGCINHLPICMWHPPTNSTDGEYFYTVVFGNQCNYSDEMTASVLVLADPPGLVQHTDSPTAQDPGSATSLEQLSPGAEQAPVRGGEHKDWIVNAYPNPVEDVVFIQSSEEITHIVLRDLSGKEILSKEIHGMFTSVPLSNYAAGYYILVVSGPSGVQSIQLVKQ